MTNVEEMQAYLDSLPVSDELVTEDERQAWSEGLADSAAGRVVTHAQVVAALGIDREP